MPVARLLTFSDCPRIPVAAEAADGVLPDSSPRASRVVGVLTGAPPKPLARSRPLSWEAFNLSARPAARMTLAAL
jgi:hypothetical protein